MLWQIKSGDLGTIIEANRDNLNDKIMEAIDEIEASQKLGLIIHMRRLTGWGEETTPEQIEEADLYMSTESLLVSFNRWAG